MAAYDVEYRYRGELYNARMNYDPGDRIRVRISVTPGRIADALAAAVAASRKTSVSSSGSEFSSRSDR